MIKEPPNMSIDGPPGLSDIDPVHAEPRSFMSHADLTENLSALNDKVNAVREQLQQAGKWAAKQADAAIDTAYDRPLLTASVSAGAALAVGLLAGFIMGRGKTENYYVWTRPSTRTGRTEPAVR